MMRKPGWWKAATGILGVVAALLFAAQASALGLGAIHVHSGLGQPFSAVIPLRTDSPSDLDGLTVGLADPAAFRQAGVISTSAVSMLRFKVKKLASGNAEVVVTSAQPIREPFVNFLVTVNWNGGTLLRQYTVLLNPPDYGSKRAVAGGAPSTQVMSVPSATEGKSVPVVTSESPAKTSAPTTVAAVAPRPRASAATPKSKLSAGKSSRVVPHGTVHAGHFGPVAPDQTLWSIAKQARPDSSVTMDQVLLSIYSANPKAFSHGRFDGLMKGVTLQIPSKSDMLGTSAAKAAKRVAVLRHAVGEAASEPTAPATPTPAKLASVPAAGGESAPVTQGSFAQGTSEAQSPPASAEGQVREPATATAQNLAALVGKPSSAEGNTTAGASTSATMTAATLAAPSSSIASGTAAEAETGGTEAMVTPPASTTAGAQAMVAGAASTAPLALAGPQAVNSSATAGTAAHAAAATTPAAAAPKHVKPVRKDPPHRIPKASTSSDFPINWRLVVVVILLLILLGAFITRNRRKQRADGGDDGSDSPVPAPDGGKQRKWGLRRTKKDGEDDVQATAGAPAATMVAAGAVAAGAAGTLYSSDDETRDEPSVSGGAQGLDVDENTEASSLAGAAVVEDDAGSATVLQDDSKDALADAEFHLAYGLYDGAIPLLKQAIAQHPERGDLKLRLADACFSAGNPTEFEAIATELQGEVGEDEWRQLAAKGRRLCPEAEVFQDVPPPVVESEPVVDAPAWETSESATADGEASETAAGLDAGFAPTTQDVSTDQPDPSVPDRVEPSPASMRDVEAAAHGGDGQDGAAEATATADDNVIQFEDSLPESHGAGDGDTEPSTLASDGQSDDEVSDIFDVKGFDTNLGSQDPSDSRDDAQKLDLGPLDFNLGEEETAGVRRPTAPSPSSEPALDEPALSPESDLHAPQPDSDGDVSLGDDASDYSSKLELAHVYVTMGDADGAREVLQEVQDHGTPAQKDEAERILRSLAAPLS